MCIINFLNSYSGGIVAIFTVILACLTFFYVKVIRIL